MNMEDAVRERHAFEDRVKRFLDLASLMTDRELEIALGRLVDLLKTRSKQRQHVQVRGEILNSYYDLRRRGVKKQRKLKRALIVHPDGLFLLKRDRDQAVSDYLIGSAVTFQLLSGRQMSPPPAKTEQPLGEMVKLLSP